MKYLHDLSNFTSTVFKILNARQSEIHSVASKQLACVASVSNRVNRVIARKLERKQKKKVEGGGGGQKRKRLPANPTILENAP